MTSYQFRNSVWIKPGYENVAAECPKCAKHNVFNRATDIGHFDPIAHHQVVCENVDCRAPFAICGDRVSAAHELLLQDACDFLKEKRYMQAILSATTAYELFFVYFLRVELLYRPARRNHDGLADAIDWLNATAVLLQQKTAQFSFGTMRELFLRNAVDYPRFATLADAEAHIMAISDHPSKVSREELERLTDEPRRSLLLRVRDTNITKLRNNIIHKTAYRPLLSETYAAVDDAYETVVRLSSYFRLGNDDFHLNESVD